MGRALDLVAAGKTVAEVVRLLEVSDQSIYSWRRQELIDRGELPGLSSAEREQLRRQAILAVVGEAGPKLYLHGHYDVVPAFHPDQFQPRVADGRLIGRGASDMKGGLAAIVYAARDAAEAGARVGLVIVPDEETGGRLGAERLADLDRLDPTAVGAIVAEPTWGTIWHACRGAFTLRVTAHGRAAHAGLHYEGGKTLEEREQGTKLLVPADDLAGHIGASGSAISAPGELWHEGVRSSCDGSP